MIFFSSKGIPVDVVELYDQFGTRGQPASAPTSAPAGAAATQEPAATSTPPGTSKTTNATPSNEANTNTSTEQQRPASPAAAATLSENMEQMRIGEQQGAEASSRREVSFLMDMDADNSGWTLINSVSVHWQR